MAAGAVDDDAALDAGGEVAVVDPVAAGAAAVELVAAGAGVEVATAALSPGKNTGISRGTAMMSTTEMATASIVLQSIMLPWCRAPGRTHPG